MMNNTNLKAVQNVRLLADGMLGRLARWLRLLGYDTALETSADDWALVRRARAEGRLLLTRDRQLAARRGLEALLIQSQALEDQVRQVILAVGPPMEGAFSRCPVCNEPLLALSHEQAGSRVPRHIHRTQQAFFLCPVCQRVYWRGTHWEKMKQMMNRWQDLTLPLDRGIMEGKSEQPVADRGE